MLTTLFAEIIILTGSLSPYCMGNIGGMFDDTLNAITVCPNLSEAHTDFVIAHELGHYFWSEKLTNKERDLYISKWSRKIEKFETREDLIKYLQKLEEDRKNKTSDDSSPMMTASMESNIVSGISSSSD